MEYRACPLCGMPVAEEDAELHCILDELEGAPDRSASVRPPPRPPRPKGAGETERDSR